MKRLPPGRELAERLRRRCLAKGAVLPALDAAGRTLTHSDEHHQRTPSDGTRGPLCRPTPFCRCERERERRDERPGGGEPESEDHPHLAFASQPASPHLPVLLTRTGARAGSNAASFPPRRVEERHGEDIGTSRSGVNPSRPTGPPTSPAKHGHSGGRGYSPWGKTSSNLRSRNNPFFCIFSKVSLLVSP